MEEVASVDGRAEERPDFEIMVGARNLLEGKRREMRALAAVTTTGSSLKEALDINVATRSVWLGVFTLAHESRAEISASLIQGVKAELETALEAARNPKLEMSEGRWAEESVEFIRRSVQARIDSLDILLKNGSLEEFASAGTLSQRARTR